MAKGVNECTRREALLIELECASWTGKYTGKAAVLIADADQV